ncbi:tRNA preQ1(34) S-adenosylmethionine ribosyltransferase-isomerase QueA [Arenibaculum sp.]|jgi:S-adenosylmethionine:tRNA ribosyltransferase-isomerase|uniref:tRNA preQ1(34) S-adenosylmethionine ribosyltransferase-isomerase QueA n=1 Tax=Arenibaculum sp. TaxID=2865862 RepID=UPI002E12B95C|nr:tRNA preQ1(34) S-adenosylmethionine ribosyltransferase-isomerase QueA [Arenibaculum sp.]
MKTAEFDFELPPGLIAGEPARPRDAARLLDVAEILADRVVRDLPDLLRPGDLLVYNDTRVIPARLAGRRGEARVEVTLHRREGPDRWRAFAKPAKRLRPGDTIAFAPGFSAEVVAKHDEGDVGLRFCVGGEALTAALHRHGTVPLPPYIRRPEGATAQDAQDYQTVFASAEGAVAAPTAGLHFTPDLLRRLEARGIGRVPVTLHVGAGTFLPVKVEDVREHRMHAEWGEVPAGTVRAVEAARRAGGRIVAVGTTSLRLLESAAAEDGSLAEFAGDTDIFITPGYRFRIVDLLLTNFHLPRSTLFMLVSAFAGLERMRAAYAHAVAAGYRFYSYGDASLLRRAG